MLKVRVGYVSLDSEVFRLGEMKAQLETSFLGSRMLYLVKNIHTLDAAHTKSWLSYVKTYEGPHGILYWSEEAKVGDGDSHLLVELPEYCDPKMYGILYGYFYPGTQLDTSFVARLFDFNQKITLDEACLLMGYQSVVGRKSEGFFSQWLSKIIVPEKSLFVLSQHLFAQQPRLFLQQWKTLKGDFPNEFWVAYWSEQLWQASLFVMRARAQGFDAAKRGAYRLPFSFINKDWKKYEADGLIEAHQFLCKLDHNLKNSAGTHSLELWYQKFLKC